MGKRRARVALFTGCVGDVMFRHTNWATARVLQQNGCDVLVPQSQGCCGAIHFHAGSERAGPRVGRREPGRLRHRRRRRDDRQRRRLRLDAQGLRPSLARRAARRAREPVRREGQATSTSSSTSWAWSRRRARSSSWRRTTTPATWRTPRRSAKPRGDCWRRSPVWSSRAARERALLRRGRHLQPDRAGDGRPARPPQAGEHPAAPAPGRRHRQRRLPAADRSARPASKDERLTIVHPMDCST